jgi:hypothetical protein
MKRLGLMILGCCMGVAAMGQNSKVGGIITYFHNQTIGDRVDLGAKVYLVNVDSIRGLEEKMNFTMATLDTFFTVTLMKGIYQYENKKKPSEKFVADNSVYHFTDKQKMDELENRVINIMQTLEMMNRPTILKKTTIGGDGKYEFSVSEGIYYIIMKSKNRTGVTKADIYGMIYPKKIQIKEEEVKDVSHNFKTY